MLERRATTCNRDCPDACRIIAQVEDGRVVRLDGDKDHPVTRGFLCYRTNHFLPLQYGPERLTTPLLRKGGSLTPVSWDEALDFIASKLLAIRAEAGPAAIFHYRSGGSLGVLKHLTDYFFERFGPVTDKRGDICSGAGLEAQMLDFGVKDSHDLFDLRNARHIILWGKNPYVSSPHLLPILKEAQAAGSKLILIDPVHHKSVRLCDHYVQPRPAGDFALAMAVTRLLFARGQVPADVASYCDNLPALRALCERHDVATWCARADVPASDAERIADALANGPTAIQVGWGMGRRQVGGAIVRALDALCAISGNLGVPGGGVSFYYKRRGAFAMDFIRGLDVAPRSICEPLFGQEVLDARDPPIRALWITAGNPVVMLPDADRVAEAVATRELSVVVDPFFTDTARLATCVLPTTTLLEDDDLMGSYGHHFVGESRPVVPPPPGVKTDLEIIQALAARVGLADVMAGSARAWKERLIAPTLGAHGIGIDDVAARGVRNPRAPTILFAERKFATPSGRVNLLRAEEVPPAALAPPPAPPDYPLGLLALSTERGQSSQWSAPFEGPLPIAVHPDSAAGIADGATARLVSPRAELTVRVVHDPRQRPDVVVAAKGGTTSRGQNTNRLIAARTTDLGEGGALYDDYVRLEPLPA